MAVTAMAMKHDATRILHMNSLVFNGVPHFVSILAMCWEALTSRTDAVTARIISDVTA